VDAGLWGALWKALAFIVTLLVYTCDNVGSSCNLLCPATSSVSTHDIQSQIHKTDQTSPKQKLEQTPYHKVINATKYSKLIVYHLINATLKSTHFLTLSLNSYKVRNRYTKVLNREEIYIYYL
jgi:hypothetical protein